MANGRADIMQHEPELQQRQTVAIIHKGPRHQIQVSLATHGGRTFGDLRLFVLNQQGTWIPTRKGCTVSLKQFDELEEAVARLRDASDQTTHPL